MSDGKYYRMSKQTHDDMRELGKMAITGIVTVGSVGVTANLIGGMLGAVPPPGKLQ